MVNICRKRTKKAATQPGRKKKADEAGPSKNAAGPSTGEDPEVVVTKTTPRTPRTRARAAMEAAAAAAYEATTAAAEEDEAASAVEAAPAAAAELAPAVAAQPAPSTIAAAPSTKRYITSTYFHPNHKYGL